MSQFYDNLAITAATLLKRYGQQMQFRYVLIPGTYNPLTKEFDSTGWEARPFWGALFDYDDKQVDGTNIHVGDIKLLAEQVSGYEPEAGHKVLVGSTEYSIIRARRLSPGGTTVITECQLRSGEVGNV